jgi:hypothetical protein
MGFLLHPVYYFLLFLLKKYGISDIFCTFARESIKEMTIKEFFKKLTAPILWGNLLAMLVIVIALCFGVRWGLGWYTHHGEGIEVPNLYGMTQRMAIRDLESKGLLVVANDSSYVEGMSAGAIISQVPAAGMKVKSGRVIYVTINSLTMPCERIPDLVDNCSYREAQARLKSLGFELLEPRLIDGEKDWVYGIQYRGRNLVAGESVPRQSALTLIIGKGAFGEDEESDDDGSLDNDSLSVDDIDTFLEIEEE